MNLTKLCVAGLCVTAMTASAVLPQQEAFEGPSYSGNWSGSLSLTTGEGGDVVAGDAYPSYSGPRPMTGVTSNYVLKLDTEGGVWTNTVNQPYGGESNPAAVYADMLVKFVPSEELPDPAGLTGKLAIAVKADANGTNRLNYTFSTGSFGAWTPVTSKEVSTSAWHRLTVKLYAVGEDSKATVYLDNEQVHDGLINGFTFNSIGFQGTGYIDEVVVRDDDPINTAVMLTLSFTAGTDIASVIVGGNPKNSGDQVTAGSTLVITAAQWKEILNVTGPSTVTWDAGAPSNSTATVTVSNGTATNVYITAQTETSTTPIGGSTYFSGEESNKVATWALDNDVTTLSNDMYNQYLLNLAEDATLPDLLITSISVSGTTVTVTVEATGVDFETINGTLMIKAYETLGGAETVYTAPVTGYSPVTIVKDIGSNKFVKIAVE